MARGAFESASTLLVVLGLVALTACGGKAKAPPATGTAGSAGGAGAGGAASTGAAGTGSGATGTPAPGSGGTGGAIAGAGGSAGVTGSGGTASGGTGGGDGGGRGGATGAAGTPGTAGTAGSGFAGGGGASGRGGAGGAGAGGAGGTGGTAGTAGTGGSAGASGCTITAASSLSTAIPTVGIVTFTTNLLGITGAQIRFGLASTGPTMTAPVDLSEPSYRTLLLGMKASRAYVFRIVLTSGAGTCTSQDYPITTGPLSSLVRRLTTAIADAGAHAPGFIVFGNGGNLVSIVDAADGEPVWGSYVRALPSRAHMSWDGKDMYVVSQNASVSVTTGNLLKMSMDGTVVEDRLSGIAAAAHHDFAVIPGGVAALQWLRSGDTANAVVERATDGTLTTVVADLAALYQGNSVSGFHPNSIHYHPWDDSYTIGDTFPRLYVKITRTGELVWQFGGSAPKDPTKHFQVTWSGENHGHQLLADGTFLFFNNLSTARVFRLDTASMTATSVLTYQASGDGASSGALGDVQRLRNGNILVTFSTGGAIHEIDSSGKLVATFRTEAQGQFSYAEFRETLYGPPPY